MDLSEDSSKGTLCRTPCCRSQLEHCSAPSLQKIPCSYPGTWRKGRLQSRICPTHSWKAIVGRHNLLCLASHKLQKAPEQHLPALPGRVPNCRRAWAEQEPRTGVLEEFPCLPAQRDGFAERGGLQQTTGSSVCKEIREGIYQAITTRSCEYSICDG